MSATDASRQGNVNPRGTGAGNWRILCIDDDPEILTVLRVSLAMRHEVVTAASGNEALRVIGVCEPDFVICDVRMPGMDGYETVAAIRRHPDFEMIPVFFLTAERGKDAARRGFEAGGNLYLNKPFDPIRLLENIDYFTRVSGHTVRPKTRSVEEVERLRDSLPAKPPAPPRPAVPAPPPPETEPTPPPAVEAKAVVLSVTPDEPLSNEAIRARNEALLADRKRREMEHWEKRYAAIQEFIDKHMT